MRRHGDPTEAISFEITAQASEKISQGVALACRAFAEHQRPVYSERNARRSLWTPACLN